MESRITQIELGKRITELRNLKGLSQNDLAMATGLSRPSIAQIELGNRKIGILELQKFAFILGFSLDEFMSEKFDTSNIKEVENQIQNEVSEERISIIPTNINKLKNVVLYILEKCAGKPNVGETVLYKLLYFSDFNYYEIYEEHLTGATYKKLPYGPVPQKLTSVIDNMISNHELKRIKTKYHGFPQTRYIPLEKADLKNLKASEKEVIDKVIDQLSDLTASTISEYSHKDIPWMASKEGEVINYELAFYRESPFSVRTYNEREEE